MCPPQRWNPLGSPNAHSTNRRSTTWRDSNSRSCLVGLRAAVHKAPWLCEQRVLKASLHFICKFLCLVKGQVHFKRMPFLSVPKLAKAQVCCQQCELRRRKLGKIYSLARQGTMQREESHDPLPCKEMHVLPKNISGLSILKRKAEISSRGEQELHL